MCFDMIDPTPADFTEAEETYINAVADFLTAERDSRVAADAQIAAAMAVRDQFDNRLDAIIRETELVSVAVRRSVGEDSPEGKNATRAADKLLQVEEAVANGADRREAYARAMILGEDPRTPVRDDPFEGVSLGGTL